MFEEKVAGEIWLYLFEVYKIDVNIEDLKEIASSVSRDNDDC